ncbi:hypothetical protein POM88_045566 [Heracleum sosnowskyi]|uniref:Uncharacterized protein n=1 Tax=Heracleum sosnowskyi TaxID=360622 RepID=A0AAD8H7Q6_9APIA|nr:hypothetical protein POM88_045566 [Heracleum sosnowskyi]
MPEIQPYIREYASYTRATPEQLESLLKTHFKQWFKKKIENDDVVYRRFNIFDNKARKTMLGTIRNYWPEGVYQYRDINARYPNWLDEICDEFKNYYRHKKGQSESEADWSIELHAKNTCKRLISDEKDRWKKKKARTGLSDEELCPSYFHPNFWDGLLNFWNSETHKHRAEVGSKNRQKVDTLHSAGAKAFEAHEMDMMKQNNGKKPPLLKLWERTHTTAASRRAQEVDATKPLEFTTPHAMYGAILEARGVNLSELTATSEVDEPIELWLATTTGSTERPQRNRIVGFPTIPATQLLSNLAHRFRERSRGGASSSSSSGNRSIIPDHAFLQIVQTAVTNAQANPDQFGNLNNSEMEEVARNIIEVSDPASRGSFNQVFFREVVNVVTTIFKSICNEAQKAIDEANKDYTTDEEVSDGEGSSTGDENGSDGIGEDNDGSDDAGEDGDVGGDNLRNDSAGDK